MEGGGALIDGRGERQQAPISQTSCRQCQWCGTTARAKHQPLQTLAMQAQQQADG
tara:strand:- start:597 stop:761 length:165 start_codon:yes stop_codon:yes gene_type:complete